MKNFGKEKKVSRLRPIEEFKIVYHKPRKLTLKILLKNFFLKILKLIFPGKHQFYENKIKSILLKIRIKLLGSNIGVDRYLFLFFEHIYIRIKYLNYIYLPYNHLHAVHILNKFMKVVRPHGIKCFLVAGALLGAVRQQCIAGSVTDVDLGIKEEELPKLLSLIPTLKNTGVDWIRQWPDEQCERLQFFFPRDHVDVGVYRKKIIEKNEVWIGETETSYNQSYKGITFPISDLENLKPIKFYNGTFLAPPNPEIYLEKKYGKNWRTPSKRQYFFSEKKFK